MELKNYEFDDLNHLKNINQPIYGTHKMSKESIKMALNLGYQIIDTATGYKNELLIKEAIIETKIKPIIITKFNETDFLTDIDQVAKKHIDDLGFMPNIVLLHTTLRSYNDNTKAFNKLKILFPNSIIGISNFDIIQLQKLMEDNCFPKIIQLEYHPYFQCDSLIKFCQDKNIIITGYRPFGKGDIIKDENIQLIGKKYNKTCSGIILSWIISKNIIPVVSSSKNQNMINNLIDYNQKINLDETDRSLLKSLNKKDGSTCMLKFIKFCGDNPVY